MKSIRQWKLLGWEKTSMFRWHSFSCLYNRVSYRKWLCIVFHFQRILKTTDKIKEIQDKPRFLTSLIFLILIQSGKSLAVCCWCDFENRVLTTDLGGPTLMKFIKVPWLTEQVLSAGTMVWAIFGSLISTKMTLSLDVWTSYSRSC